MFLGSWAWSLPRTSRRSLWAVVWSRGESLKRFSTSLCFEVSFIHNYSWTNRHFHRKRNFKCTLLLLKITVKNHKQHFQTLTIPNKDFPPHDIVYKYFPKNKAILASKRKYAMNLILAPLTFGCQSSVIIVIYSRQVEMPFGEGLDAGKGEVEWIVARDKPKY